MVGMVNVNADNVTRRIFVITDANFQNNQGDGLAVHAWYTDESGDIFTVNTDNEKMAIIADYNPTGKKGLWMKDITFDAAKTIKFFVYKKGNTAWHSSDDSQQTLSSSSDMTYYSWASDGNGALTNEGTVTYDAYLYDGTSTWTRQSLSCDDHYTFTATIDNETSYNSALEVIIAPSIAFLSDLSSAKWDIMYRPNSENQTVGFNNQSYYAGGCWHDNSNSLKLNAAAHYDLTFYPYGWTYSIAPYFTKTMSADYATFASDYAVAIPTGVTASYATGVSGNELSLTAFEDGIPANTGVLLYKSGGGEITFTPASSTDDIFGNLFVRGEGSTVTWHDDTNEKTNYILTTQTVNNNNAPIGFYKINKTSGNTVGTDKAYLSLSDNIAPAREFLTFGDVNVTGIATPKVVKNINGYYNLNGQRIAQPSKGLYLVNGKKVMVK